MAINLYANMLSPPSRAVMIVAKQLGIKLNLINTDHLNGENQTDEFVKLNPRKLVPVLADDGFILWESRAILTFLINKYSPGHKLYPIDPKTRAEIDRALFLTSELFDMAKAIGKKVFYDKQPVPEEGKKGYIELLKVLEQLASGHKFLIGDEITIADISLLCDLTVFIAILGLDIASAVPGIANWMERIKTALPEYEEFIEKPLQDLKKIFAEKFGNNP